MQPSLADGLASPGRWSVYRRSAVSPALPVRGEVWAAESAASDFFPFPAIRVQGDRRDLGQGRVQLRQLQAPHRPGTGLLAGPGFLHEPFGLAVMIWAVHSSPSRSPALPLSPGHRGPTLDHAIRQTWFIVRAIGGDGLPSFDALTDHDPVSGAVRRPRTPRTTPLGRRTTKSPGPASRLGSGRSGRYSCLRPPATGRTVSLISSLIHIRVPTSITGYHRALSSVYRPAWSILDGDPSSISGGS